MEGEARLVVEAREDVRIERASVARGESAVIAEALRRLRGGFVICQFGGLVVPDEGDLKPLASVLECPCSWCGRMRVADAQRLRPRVFRRLLNSAKRRLLAHAILQRKRPNRSLIDSLRGIRARLRLPSASRPWPGELPPI
jgi:hypothetical protein